MQALHLCLPHEDQHSRNWSSTRAQAWPREERPKGILGSCDMALRNDTCSAMGATEEDFQFVVEDVAGGSTGRPSRNSRRCRRPSTKQGAEFFLNQNSREPVTEPDEMVPLWKILHLAGADWTYGTKGWAAENYCMFLADDENWEHIVRDQGQSRGGSGLQGLAQHGVRARTLRSPGRTEKIQHSLTTLKSRASFNIMPSGSGKAS